MRSRALLLLLGILAVFFIVSLFFREKPYQQTVPESYDFQCMSCNHDWTAPIQEADAWYPGGMANDVHPVKCASCAKPQALLKRTCLWCSERYIPSAETWQKNKSGSGLYADQASSYRADKARVPEICPHCDKDVLKWQPDR